VKLHLERVLLYNEHKIGPPAQDFIMVLQSPWQLAQILEFLDGKHLVMDNTFSINRYNVSLFYFIDLFFCLKLDVHEVYLV
jgi:hypothetical protein